MHYRYCTLHIYASIDRSGENKGIECEFLCSYSILSMNCSIHLLHIKTDLQWNIPVLFPWILSMFSLQCVQFFTQAAPRLSGLNNCIDKSSLCCNQWIGKLLAVLLSVTFDVAASENDFYRAFRTHHCDFRRRPSKVDVSSEMLRRHDVIRASIRLARDDREFGDLRLSVSVQELGTVANDATVLLLSAGQKARNIHESQQWNVERITESHESSGFRGCIDVKAAGELFRLISNDSDCFSFEARESNDDILGIIRLNLEERAVVVDEFADNFMHIVWSVRVGRNDVIERLVLSHVRVASAPDRSRGLIAHWQEAKNSPLQPARRCRC